MGPKKTKLMLYSTQLKLKLKLELSLAIFCRQYVKFHFCETKRNSVKKMIFLDIEKLLPNRKVKE